MKDLCTRGRSAINLLLLIAIFQIWILVPVEGSEAEINSEVTTLREVFQGRRCIQPTETVRPALRVRQSVPLRIMST